MEYSFLIKNYYWFIGWYNIISFKRKSQISFWNLWKLLNINFINVLLTNWKIILKKYFIKNIPIGFINLIYLETNNNYTIFNNSFKDNGFVISKFNLKLIDVFKNIKNKI